jgi:hypothetical protein
VVAVDVCKSVIEKEDIATAKFGVFVSDPSLEVEEANTTFSKM